MTKGKKVEVNGHKECEGNKKTCWLWFPDENANTNAYIIKNQSDELEITLYLSSLSSLEIQQWAEDISNGYIDLTDDVQVDNSAFLDIINEDDSIIIESGIYNITVNAKDNCISFILPFIRN